MMSHVPDASNFCDPVHLAQFEVARQEMLKQWRRALPRMTEAESLEHTSATYRAMRDIAFVIEGRRHD